MDRKLLIKTTEQTAELWEENHLLRSYRISTAINGLGCNEGSQCTPYGKLKVAKKIGNNAPIGSVFRSRISTGELWSNESVNSLFHLNEDLVLTRILWLEGAETINSNTFDRFIYIHGTNQEHLLGQPSSHGCIRFSNHDIKELFDLLEEGSEVEVVE